MVSSSSVIMCSESDSDSSSGLTKESIPVSRSESGTIGSTLTDQVQYYENKLLSTMQILNNKDEMLSIQDESLKMAEVRISTLTVRNTQLQAELDKKIQEIRLLRQDLDIKSRTPPRPARNGGKTIRNLQNNLSVIENLYRDCFYESARQEEIIETLRNSFLQIRDKEDEKSEEISRLQGVVVTQKWNLERCQDIAQELESLKSEIANVLNSANNDSGMWERSEDYHTSCEISRDLQDITRQLLQLKRLLDTDCLCGLQDENQALKLENEKLQRQIKDTRTMLDQLEERVQCNDESIEQYQNQIQQFSTEINRLAECLNESERSREELLKEREMLLNKMENESDGMTELREKLKEMESTTTNSQLQLQENLREMSATKKSLDGLKDRLKNSKFLVKSRTSDMERLRTLCQEHECTIKTLKEELNNAQFCLKENTKMRSEISFLSNQVMLWQAQLADSTAKIQALEEQLTAAQKAYEDLQFSYRKKTESVVWLERDLMEASSRGAELCAESRHVVCGVREWMQRMRHNHQEQQSQIQELNRKVWTLKMRLSSYEGPSVSRAERFHQDHGGKEVTERYWRGLDRAQCSKDTDFREADSSKSESTEVHRSPSPPLTTDCTRQMHCTACVQERRSNTVVERNVSPTKDLISKMENLGNNFNSKNRKVLKKIPSKSFRSRK